MQCLRIIIINLLEILVPSVAEFCQITSICSGIDLVMIG